MKSRGNKSREDKYGPSSNSVGVPGADGLEKQIIPTAGSGKVFSEENSVTTKVLEGNQKNMDADMEGLEEAHQLAFKPEEGVVTGQIDVGELGCEGQAHQLAFKPEEGVVTGQIAVGELGCEGQVYAEPKSPPIKTTGRKWKRAARKGPNSNVLSGLPSPIQRILSARKIAKGRGRHGSASPVKRSPTCKSVLFFFLLLCLIVVIRERIKKKVKDLVLRRSRGMLVLRRRRGKMFAASEMKMRQLTIENGRQVNE
ncbi:hypothetical protein ACOSP7_013217 [Xanthoceras sorbifolium]